MNILYMHIKLTLQYGSQTLQFKVKLLDRGDSH